MNVTYCLPIEKEHVEYGFGPFDAIDSALDFVYDLLDCGAFNVVVEFDNGYRFRVVNFGSGLRSYPLAPAKSSSREPNLSTNVKQGGSIT